MTVLCFFFFNDTATTEIYTYGHTLSLHDALPIWHLHDGGKKLEDEQPDKEQERTLHEVREDNGVDDVPMIAQEARPAGDVVHGECRQQPRGAPAARNAQREEADHGPAFRAGIGRLRRRNHLRIALTEALRLWAGQLCLSSGNQTRKRGERGKR